MTPLFLPVFGPGSIAFTDFTEYLKLFLNLYPTRLAT